MRHIHLILASVAALALAACGSESAHDAGEAASEAAGDSAEHGEYRIDESSGETSMTIATPEGEASMRAGAQVRPNLPQGWTIYPDATIENAINVDQADGSGTMVRMLADATMDEVIDHYRGQAEATGYSIDLDLTTATSRVIGGKKPDGSTFSVSVTPGADGSPASIQLTMANEP